MGGDSAGDVDADGSDFAFARGGGLRVVETAPDAGESGDAAGADAVDAAKTNEGFFHHPYEVDGTETSAVGVLKTAEIEDWVADELAWAVVGDVAAAIDFVKRDTACGEEFVGGEDVGAAGISAEGEDGRVFEEKQGVVDRSGEAQASDFRLDAKGFVVGYAAEVEVLDHDSFNCMDADGSALWGWLEDGLEVRTDAQEHEEPEKADDGGHGESGRGHGDVGEINVDDHSSQNSERERNVAIDEKQDGRSDLEETDGDVVVGDGKSSGEVRHGAGRHGRRGNEVEEHVRSEDKEDDAHQITSDRSCNFHEGPP